MPAELLISGSGEPPELLALRDGWYQDVVLAGTGRLLAQGIEWIAGLSEGRSLKWSLSGRDIYVLGRNDELSGFVSIPRLILGEQHVVLCVAERLREVQDAIGLTDSPEPTLLSSANGLPDGWVGLRGVTPAKPVIPSPSGDILDALRPLAQVEIALTGGIRFARQTWLYEYPPNIRLVGDAKSIDMVLIDGNEASSGQDGSFVSLHWDSVGEHTVWCATGSRSYTIQRGAEDWPLWDAYQWSLGEGQSDGARSRPAICGAVVCVPDIAHAVDRRVIVVSTSNPILIGAVAGEIEFCTPRRDVRTELCAAAPWFEPVWAIPANPLRCNKRSARIRLVGGSASIIDGRLQDLTAREQLTPGALGDTRQISAWCSVILNAAKKGLEIEPHSPEVATLWLTYVRGARALRRHTR
jgi:hypothetical protein